MSITVSSHSLSGRLPAMSMGRVMFSRALRVGTRLNDWNTNPTPTRRSRVSALSDSPVNSVSPIQVWPDVTESSPAMQCISVDLPEPEGPITAV